LGTTIEEVEDVIPLDPAGATLSTTVFDALPFAAFVVDDDIRLLAVNTAANRLVSGNAVTELRQRGGEALHCINSAEGCGKSKACADCVIRTSVHYAVSNAQPIRRRAKLEFYEDGSVREMSALVTASPLAYDGRRCALLSIENLTLLFALTDALPICMGCKKVRDDDLWMQIEAYLDDHLDLKFSHGLCPDCASRLYPEYDIQDGNRDLV
jgi:hypothetical protein